MSWTSEKQREYMRAWRVKNRAKIRGYDAKHRSTAKRRAYMKQWRADNRERLERLCAQWRAENHDRVRAAQARRRTKPEYKAYMAAYHKLWRRQQALLKRAARGEDVSYAEIARAMAVSVTTVRAWEAVALAKVKAAAEARGLYAV